MISSRARPAFTLIELLIVIAIIALLISILVPALAAAREEGRRAVCVSNMRSIGVAVNQYLGNDSQDNLPCTYVYAIQPGTPLRYSYWPGDDEFPATGRFVTSYTWGGTISSHPFPADAAGHDDHTVTPAEVRPLNRYLEPGAVGRAPVKVTQCPGDRSAVSPFIGRGIDDPMHLESDRTSYEAYGNSYSINFYFMDEPDIPTAYVEDIFEHGKHAVRINRNGAMASEWVIMWENQCDQLWVGSTIQGNTGRIGKGWHGRWSYHTFLFLDGHAEHKYFDTRNVKGPGWRVYRKWQLFDEPPFLDPPWG